VVARAHALSGVFVALSLIAVETPTASQAAASRAVVTVGRFDMDTRHFDGLAQGLPSLDATDLEARDGVVYVRTAAGSARFDGGQWRPAPFPARVSLSPPLALLPTATATGRDGRIAVATSAGLSLVREGRWYQLQPRTASRSWAPRDVRGVAFDARDRLWFASPQGVGRFDGSTWQLWTIEDGLPFDDFTSVSAGHGDTVWFGTTHGAIRFDGRTWEYRQGPRWLPDDHVRAIAVDRNGQTFFATGKGVGRIVRRGTTLAEKARLFEEAIDRHHRRTSFGFVDSVRLPAPGDLSRVEQHDSDNDGLWTSMYGAGQAFAFAVTKDPAHRERAVRAFEAMRFLRTVTISGSHVPPPGFVARTVVPVGGRDPNLAEGAAFNAARQKKGDRLWKSLEPRWPLSADGKWYWKADTSSDELDGHYFFYAAYYDLVASTDAERASVREHVAALTDHLITHRFRLIDHDGLPTRWAVYDPASLNFDRNWAVERGLNSTSILAYLRVAAHVTGDARYGAAAQELITRHGYAMNTLIPKTFEGFGGGNQSDDEMAFMNLWCLLRYEKDPQLRAIFGYAFYQRWLMERPELNPLFHFLYAASVAGLTWTTAFDETPLAPEEGWLEEAVDALKRFPLDRVNWPYANSHRRDVVPLPLNLGSPGRGMRRDGRALPIDERFVDKWNHDPWRLDQSSDGRTLADGTSFLLPYYLGRYAGFLVD
jgi:hypothetical protein